MRHLRVVVADADKEKSFDCIDTIFLTSLSQLISDDNCYRVSGACS